MDTLLIEQIREDSIKFYETNGYKSNLLRLNNRIISSLEKEADILINNVIGGDYKTNIDKIKRVLFVRTGINFKIEIV